MKLRGQISQGPLIPISVLNRPALIGENVTEELGIQKYEAPIPACLGGSVVGQSEFKAWLLNTIRIATNRSL